MKMNLLNKLLWAFFILGLCTTSLMAQTPMIHWSFEETSGTTTSDLSGNNRNGSLINGLSFETNSVEGISGNALKFEGKGTNKIVKYTGHTVGGYPFTMSAWVKLSNTGEEQTVVSMANTDFYNQYVTMGVWRGGELYTNVRKGDGGGSELKKKAPTPSVFDGQWHMITAVYLNDTTTIRYQDGALADTLQGNKIKFHYTKVFAVGALHRNSIRTSTTVNGAIDEVYLYKGALTAGEINTLFKSATSLKVNATVTGGGTIDPSGIVLVESGYDQTFNITPDAGHEITDVLVDGVSVGAVSSYTFNGITEDHTIEAIFSPLDATVSTVAELVNAVNNGFEGQTILVEAGEYVLEGTDLLHPKKGMTIKGAGIDATIIKPAASWNPPPTEESSDEDGTKKDKVNRDGYIFSFKSASNITLSDFTIEGDYKIHGAVFAESASDVEIYNLKVLNFHYAGIRHMGCSRWKIHDNIFVNAAGKPGKVEGAAIYLTWTSYTEIYNNHISANDENPTSSMGIKFRQIRNTEIHHNTVLIPRRGFGFAMEAAHKDDYYVELHHNRFEGTISIPKNGNGGGTFPDGRYSFHFHHNWLSKTYTFEGPRRGVIIEHNFIDPQDASDNAQRTWTDHSGSHNLEKPGILFSNNLIKDPGRAIFWSKGTVYKGFEFYNNEVRASLTVHPDPLFQFGSKTVWEEQYIKDNIFDCSYGPDRDLLSRTEARDGVNVENNKLVGISDAGSFNNAQTGNVQGTTDHLYFNCGYYGEYLVNGWNAGKYLGADATAPVVSITAPANGATFTQGDDITITANASGESISKIAFYYANTLIGEATSAPYQVIWQNVPHEARNITAVAYDNNGASTVSEVVTVVMAPTEVFEPQVAITYPTGKEAFMATGTIPFTVDTEDKYSNIAKVEYFANGTKIGEATVAPFNFDWTNIVAGSYQITTVAHNDGGATATSNAVSVEVIPFISDNFYQTENASSTEGSPKTSTSVAEFLGTGYLELENASQTLTWDNINVAEAGNYRLQIRYANPNTKTQEMGIEVNGQVLLNIIEMPIVESGTWGLAFTDVTLPNGASSIKLIGPKDQKVYVDALFVSKFDNEFPTCTLVKPTGDVNSPIGTVVGLEATAADTDGTIVKVEFFDGVTKLVELTEAPYEFPLEITAAKAYNIRAKATDDKGSVAFSTTVEVLGTNSAIVQSVDVLEDTYVRGGAFSRHNHGSGVALHLKKSSNDGYTRETLLKFDISSFSGSTGDIALQLYMESMQDGGDNHKVQLYAADNSWAENSVIWESKPSYGDLIAEHTLARADVESIISLDVTDYINTQKGVNNTITIALLQPAGVDKFITFSSKEGSFSPRLVELGDVEFPTTIALTKPAPFTAKVEPGTFLLDADASHTSSTIDKVEYFAGNDKIGEATTAPYTFNWTNVAAGKYSLRALASAANGDKRFSEPIEVYSLSTTNPTVTTAVTTAEVSAATPDALDKKSADLLIQKTVDGSGDYEAYLKFSLQGLTEDKLKSVKLVSYGDQHANGTRYNPYWIEFYPSAHVDWDRSNLTWNVASTFERSERLLGQYNIFESGYDTLTSDGLRRYVREQLAAGEEYITLNLRAKDSLAWNVWIGGSWRTPHLLLEYTDDVVADGIEIITTSASVKEGETVQLSAAVIPANAANQNVLWASLNELVATVDNAGVITGVAAGEANIVAISEDGGYQDKLVVTVEPPMGTTATVFVDHTKNGGVWNNLGTYNFRSGGTDYVRIRTDNTSGDVVADAVMFSKEGEEDIVLDTESPLGIPAGINVVGEWYSSKSQSGHIGTGYLHDGNKEKGNKSVTYVPTFPVSGEWTVYVRYTSYPTRAKNVPVDIYATGDSNPASSVSITSPANGELFVTGTPIDVTTDASGVQKVVFYNSLGKIGEATAAPFNLTWDGAADGNHIVYAKVIANNGLATTTDAVSIRVISPSAPTAIEVVNQRKDGGKWNDLGTYNFSAGGTDFVRIRTDNTNGYVLADAVKFTKEGEADIILDSEGTAGIDIVGSWSTSKSTAGYWGTGYVHDGNKDKGTKSVKYTPSFPVGGEWTVYVRWASYPNRASNVPIDIYATGGATGTSAGRVAQGALQSYTDDALETGDKLLVYPNPATDVLNFQLTKSQLSNIEVSVYDIFGKEVLHKQFIPTSKSNQLDISTLGAGAYILNIKGQSQIFHFKWIKQ